MLWCRSVVAPCVALALLAGCSLFGSEPPPDNDRSRDDPEGPPVLPACTGADDCDADEVCLDEHCHVGCASDDDCRGFYQTCDDLAGACVQCVADSDCGPGDVCIDRLCESSDVPCTAGAEACDGARVMVCDEDTGAFSLRETCDDDAQCVVREGAASCVSQVCEANAIGCVDEQTAFVCNSDGTEQIEAPCRDDQLCRDGGCVLLVCTPGRDTCAGNTLVRCNADGTEAVATSCDDVDLCTGQLGCACVEDACVERVCPPLSGRCVGNSAQRCDQFGLAYGALTECGADLCVEGLCLNDTCPVGDAFCSGTTLVACDQDGVGYDVTQCPETCSGNPGDAACSDQVCEPSSQICDGNTLLACNSTGTNLAEIPCGSTQYCEGGACLSQVCTPNARRCGGDDVLRCDARGSGEDVLPCGADQTCAGGECVDDSCTPTCGARTCGPDPTCGVSCGGCEGVCNAQGQCLIPEGPELTVLVSWPAATGVDLDAYLTRDDTSMCDNDTCYFGNCTPGKVRPNWDGAPGNSVLDPLLDVADIVNDDPETLRLTLPTVAETYRVGAHVYNDGNANGATSRSATIRVLVDDVQVATFTRSLAEKTMWDGVTLQWNGTSMTASDTASLIPNLTCSETPTTCEVDGDCDPGEVCVDDGGFLSSNVHCREGCRNDNACDGSDVCNGNNECGPAGSTLAWKAPCQSDSNCDVGFTCGFLSGVCEESCLPACTPGTDCCLLSGGDVCTPDAFIGLFGSCDP